MKEHNFNLKIEFESKIYSDEEIKEIMGKIINALVHEVEAGNGLAPEEADTFTTKVTVKSDVIQEESTYNFL